MANGDLERRAKRNRNRGMSSGAVKPEFEERLIILSQGIESHNADSEPNYRFPEYFKMQFAGNNSLSTDKEDPTLVIYKSIPQRINYVIKLITQKDEFKLSLEAKKEIFPISPEKIMVVYSGHSRLVEDHALGNASHLRAKIKINIFDPVELISALKQGRTGIMVPIIIDTVYSEWGYPYVPIPIKDIIHHKYKCNPKCNPVSISQKNL